MVATKADQLEKSASVLEEILLPYQVEWVGDKTSFKISEKSRRTGFTWADACDSVLTSSAARQAGGMDSMYVGYNKEMSREYIEDCAFWARHFNIAAGEIEEGIFNDEDKDILTYRIKFASGFEIIALSSRPSNLRGRQGKVTIDEAAFHDDLNGLLKAAMAFLMWGGRVAVISTHNGDDNPYNDLLKEIRSGKRPGKVHRVTIDDALEQGLYQRICLKLDQPWSKELEADWKENLFKTYGADADEELLCIPSQGSGVFFTRALIESCMNPNLPVLQWICDKEFVHKSMEERESVCEAWCDDYLKPLLEKLDPSLNSFVGGDFGRTGDLSCFWPALERKNLTYLTPFIIELSKVPFEQQRQVLFYLIDGLKRFRGGALDARGNGQYLAEVAMQRYGADRIHQVMITEKFYREYMPKYKTHYEDRTFEIPLSADIVDDHRALKMIKGVAKIPDNIKTTNEKGIQRHGDSAIAGCMCSYAIKEINGVEIEYVSTGEKRESLSTVEGW